MAVSSFSLFPVLVDPKVNPNPNENLANNAQARRARIARALHQATNFSSSALERTAASTADRRR